MTIKHAKYIDQISFRIYFQKVDHDTRGTKYHNGSHMQILKYAWEVSLEGDINFIPRRSMVANSMQVSVQPTSGTRQMSVKIYDIPKYIICFILIFTSNFQVDISILHFHFPKKDEMQSALVFFSKSLIMHNIGDHGCAISLDNVH